MHQYLVFLQNEDRRQALYAFFMDDRSGQGGIEKTFYIKRNALVLQRLDGFWMDHLRTVIGHFDHLVITQLTDEPGFRELFGIGIHDPFHVLPDGLALRIQQISKYGCRVIAALSPQSSTLIFRSGPYKALGDHDR